VRVRENVEGIALYRGEESEYQNLRDRFSRIIENWWLIMKRQKMLNWFTIGFNQVANIFPILVAAPRYFSGAIQLGGVFQTAQAFGQVQDAMSWFVNSYTDIADWKATVDRLTSFHRAMEKVAAEQSQHLGISVQRTTGVGMAADNLTLGLPGGKTLITGA